MARGTVDIPPSQGDFCIELEAKISKDHPVMARGEEVELGRMERAYVVRCAICGRKEVYPGHNKGRKDGAAAEAEGMGWKKTSQIGPDGDRLWVCSKHHEPNSYALYVDKDHDRREPKEVTEGLP